MKSTVLTYQPAIKMPHLPNAVIATKELIVRSDYQLSKSQWKEEQMADVSIKHDIKFVPVGTALHIQLQKDRSR